MSSIWKCPLCCQTWVDDRGLRRHLCVPHDACRFCERSYVRVDRHERLMHTRSFAEAEISGRP